MDNPPVNVKLRTPTSAPGWPDQEAIWLELNRQAYGHPGFFPLTIKAAYVIGVIHDICESVQILLGHRGSKHVSFLPAYGVFAAGVELLGRCLNGNATTTGSTNDLKAGFKWLVSNDFASVSDEQVVVKTSVASYSVEALASLRHFAAHGQATAPWLADIDFGLLAPMPPRLGEGLDRYWNSLLVDDDRCERLSRAAVVGFRNWPVFKSWNLFQGNQRSRGETITGIFSRFDWRVR